MNDELVTTIGLEVHVELNTATKLFCGCRVAFGGEPNTRVCPICLGHPGTLPVPNETAVEFALTIALALDCEIVPKSIFHRKNYFYPDMPKNYQISQYDIPIGTKGTLPIQVNGARKLVGITRVHLEEDTGKTIHVGGGGRLHEATHSLEDFNRAGTPLVEIVTEPNINSPEEARVFAADLRSILEFLGVSDVRMEEGSMRVDANISVAKLGERGVKTEVKNMNSLKSLQRALVYEQERLSKALREGDTVEQSTRHWDEKSGMTTPMRSKEFSEDYRYFPEPDLVPLEPSVELMRQLREELPELPSERRRRFEEMGNSGKVTGVLVSSKWLADFYEAAVASAKKADAKQVGNWVANDLMGALGERGEEASESKITSQNLAELVDLVAEGRISNNQAKEVLVEILESGKNAAAIVEEKGIRQVSDRGELEAIVSKVIEANPDAVEKIRGGDEKPLGFLVGQVMRETKGKGNAALINELLRENL